MLLSLLQVLLNATGMFQTSSKCYDRAVLLCSRPIVLATTLPNKEEGSRVLGPVAKILQNPVPYNNEANLV